MKSSILQSRVETLFTVILGVIPTVTYTNYSNLTSNGIILSNSTLLDRTAIVQESNGVEILLRRILAVFFGLISFFFPLLPSQGLFFRHPVDFLMPYALINNILV